MSTHINAANKNDIAESILLPGDPLRAKFIAENFLDSPKCYNEIRGMLGYTGTYRGVPVSVQGTGMGMPSMGIYSWELITEYGVQNLIRIGTAGSFHEDIKVRDIVVGMAASTDSNYIHAFDVPGNYAPCASRQSFGTHVCRGEIIPEYLYGTGWSGNDRICIQLSGIDKAVSNHTGK